MNYKHILLLLFAAIFFFSAAIAQPRIKGQQVIGGANDDGLSDMYSTKDKGLIIGGSSKSNISAQKTENKRGGYDYWVVKLDSNYKIQWDKTIGGNYNDYLYAVQQTTDGGYIAGGASNSDISGEKTESRRDGSIRGGNDYWVVKLDSGGAVQWDKTIGGKGPDVLRALVQTTDGGYILGGYSSSKISGEKTDSSRGSNDYWIVKLDSNHNIQWDKTIGGSNDDVLYTLQQTSDGGYIAGGYSNSNISGEKTQNSRGSTDYWVVKLDAAGNKQWDKTIGSGNDDYLITVRQTTDGGYILGGQSDAYTISGDKTENGRGVYDYWIIKLDANGAIQWDKTIGSNSWDELWNVRQTTDGGYILVGASSGNISGEKTENSRGGDRDYWVVKINNKGKVQWDKTIGGNNYDAANNVVELKKNRYVIGGTSSSPVSGDKTIGVRGGNTNYGDMWLVELNYVKPDSVAIAQVRNSMLAEPQASTNAAFSIYPNPATTVLHIQNVGKATFILSDQSGKRMLTKTVTGNSDLNVAAIPAGTYYLTNTATGTTQKVIISK